jgi:NAD(P)H-hydrate epimerase
MIRIFTHENNRQVIQRMLPEAMINTYDTQKFDENALAACLNWCDVVAVGPGLSTGIIQKKIVEQVLDSKLPAVIDADGINNISEEERLKKKLHKKIILTPHLAEMSRLIGEPVKTIAGDLIRYAQLVHYKYNANCVLKDARTVITTEKQTFINLTGNSGMATAGSGDVLTGIIAGLIGIGTDFDNAAVLGPYIHGIAGDRAAERVSRAGLMATDIIEELKNIFI